MGKFENLEKIQQLKEQGILSQEQFEIEKSKILSGKNNEKQEDGAYTGSLVLGIFAFLLGAIPIVGMIISIIALIVCGRSKKKLKKNNDKNGKVTGGLILSILGLLISLFMTIVPIGIVILSGSNGILVEASKSAYDSELESELKLLANEMNVMTPVMIDEITRLDNVEVKNHDTVVYNYTIIGYTYDEAKVVFHEVAQESQKELFIKTIKISSDFEYFRENKVNLEYSYKSEEGKYLFTIELPNELFI